MGKKTSNLNGCKLIFQLRADPSSSTGVKDLQGNIWAVEGNSKLEIGKDPFEGNNAFKIDALNGSKWLVLKSGNALWNKDSIPNFTLATWMKIEKFGGNGFALPLSICGNGHASLSPMVCGNSMQYLYDGTASPQAVTKTDDNTTGWNYFEFGFEGTILRIFRNGKLLSTNTITRSFAGLHQDLNWIGQYQWWLNYGVNGSTFYLCDYCLMEGVLHRANYEVPKQIMEWVN